MMFEQRVAIITGASRGIGAATVRAFADAGAKVVLCARSANDIQLLAEEIGPSACAVACDVSNYSQIASMTEFAVREFGSVDILINNAAVIQPISHIANSDPEQWAQAVNINLTGVYNAIRAVLPVMHKAGGGTILTVSSGAAQHAIEAWSHYCASKAGAAMLMRCLDLEERPKGVRAMGLSPGTVATQMQREIKASGINPVSQLDWSDHIPPDWVARALLWMCGPDADEFLGDEISLRDEDIRRRIGLI